MGCSGGNVHAHQSGFRTHLLDQGSDCVEASLPQQWRKLTELGPDALPSQEMPRFLPLTTLRLGRHAASTQELLFLWVDIHRATARGSRASCTTPKRLVFVAAQSGARTTSGRPRGPFASPDGVQEAGIVALELKLEDVTGFDFWSSLLVDTNRIVIEAKMLERHWFPTLRHCAEHFSWDLPSEVQQPQAGGGGGDEAAGGAPAPAPASRGAAVEGPASFLRALYRPQVSGVDRRFVLPRLGMQSTVYEDMDARSPRAQPYWRQEKESGSSSSSSGKESGSTLKSKLKRATSCISFDASGGVEGEAKLKPGTTVSETIRRQTLHFGFDDIFVAPVLQEVIHDPDNPHLLRRYESGMPAWAIWTSRHFGFHCHTLRILVFYLLLIISLVSMILGLLDLYRKWPTASTFFTPLLRPINSTLDWLGVSEFPLSLRWLDALKAMFGCCWCGAQALARLFRPVLMLFGVWDVAQELSQTAIGALQACVQLARGIAWAGSGGLQACWQAVAYCLPLCGRGASLFSSSVMPAATLGASGVGTFALFRAELVQVNRAIMSIYNFTIFLGVKCARHQASIIMWVLGLRARVRRKLPSWLVPVVAWAPSAFLCLLVLGGIRQAATYSASATWADFIEAGRNLPGAAMKALALMWQKAQELWSPAGTATPLLAQVQLSCGVAVASPLLCWHHVLHNFDSCSCRYEDLQGLSVVTAEPFASPLRISARVHSGNRTSLTSLACEEDGFANGNAVFIPRLRHHCHIPASQLQRVLGGGLVEVDLLGYRGSTPGEKLTVTELASFAIDVPRKPADPLQSVRLCDSPRVGETTSSHWSLMLPDCDDGIEVDLAAAARLPFMTGELRETRAYASWEAGELNSCHFQSWEVFLEVDGRLNHFCSVTDANAAGCWGVLPEHHFAAYGLRALASIHCSEAEDEPKEPSASLWYTLQVADAWSSDEVYGSVLLLEVETWVLFLLIVHLLLRSRARYE
mmetsp:Transcript_67015/g.160610  ORF Transcript_67015/g.160610 Transcript_67015/m.160610 type:complete len:976 (-) Transcript_67015:136-3063(-)|eukprot:CAMPEP_0178397494 /NCGR_PEP_ID=MMETSP0689_2-20121128/14276_1 /TAXON_ID=160604 /ORGANISM="Amphidinium massartii, Strain CS-259" /LENGTH=975 /DNA_ID=CAMNT_0020018207 /DNA_START=110 /DNA_END=3037 /DNA_ORIENTATION=-